MVSLDDIEAARARIRDAIYESPCARSEYFSQACGCTTYFKLENLQMTGSFKERGALNRILMLDDEERRRGIITASAGNHAQAVAYHAGKRGIRTTIVMPKRSPLIKVANTRSYGATVHLQGDSFDEAYQYARTLEQSQGFIFVHPFDDPLVIAGQGTIALELMEQQPDLEVVIVPIGGGGVISGIAAAYKARKPEVRIVGVQTAALPSMKASLERGEPVEVPPAFTIADGIAIKRPGGIPLEMVRRFVDAIVTVDEEEIANAILLLLEREKTVVEGAGATPLAALYNGHVAEAAGRRVCMVLCGGNIDVNLLSRIIEQGLAKDGRLIRVEVTILDRPGALAQLLQLVARTEANVLEVHHQRAFDVELGDVAVELKLETRGLEHKQEISRAMKEAGLRVREL